MTSSDRIRIAGIPVVAILGVLAHERRRAQSLKLDLELELDLEMAAASCDLELTVDYGRLGAAGAFVLEAGGFRLLETAALALCHLLLAPPFAGLGHAKAATVALAKPEALGGAGTPSVVMRRTAAQLKMPREAKGEGRFDRLFECADAGVYRLHKWPSGQGAPVLPAYLSHRDFSLGPETVLRVATPAVAPPGGA